jgi:probable F420-dependent oxidoreductase
VKISIQCRPFAVPAPDIAGCVEVARLADMAGLYGIHFGEHVVMGQHPEAYPYPGVTYSHRLDAEWLEPLITLGAMAAVTSRLRLSTGVLLAPLRSGALLAKSLASLDVLSHGRLEVAVGTGWQREEYDASGVDWQTRYQRLLDSVRVCRALWEPAQPVSLATRTYTFTNIYCSPRPVQPRLPVLFGWALNERRARHIAELGDGWVPSHVPLADLPDAIEMLRAAFAAAGRSSEDMIVRAGPNEHIGPAGAIDLPRMIDEAHRYEAAGVTVLAFPLPSTARSLGDVEEHFGRLSELSIGGAS